MLEHNKICVNIKQLEDQLSEINYWLISSSKQILLLKNTINFELIESYTSVKKKEKSGKRQKSSKNLDSMKSIGEETSIKGKGREAGGDPNERNKEMLRRF